MGAGEGIDDFGQCAEMQVKQAADRVVVEVPVAFGRERSDAFRALESLHSGRQPPAAALVAAHFGSSSAQPGVVQQCARDGGRRQRIREQLGIERKDSRTLHPPAGNDHAPPQVGRPSPFAIDPLAAGRRVAAAPPSC